MSEESTMILNPIRVLIVVADIGKGQELYSQIDEVESIKVLGIAGSQKEALDLDQQDKCKEKIM